MQKKTKIYSGKAKSLYTTEDPNWLVVEFRNDISAFDGEKKEQLSGKGAVNSRISAHLMTLLEEAGIPTHFGKQLSENTAVVRNLKMIPLESVLRNLAAGSLCRRLGVEPHYKLDPALYELFLKNDALHDPMVNHHHVTAFGWATAEQLQTMELLARKAHSFLTDYFSQAGLILVDAKYEFGVDALGKMYVGDEITPDSCRIWTAEGGEVLDKDRFRQNMGGVVAAYETLAARLGVPMA